MYWEELLHKYLEMDILHPELVGIQDNVIFASK